jgi:hypothetical protein
VPPALVVATVMMSMVTPASADRIPAVPIPQGPGAESAPRFLGAPAEPNRVRSFGVPRHPFMAPNGRSNVHDDAYMTDSYRGDGPLGWEMDVLSTYQQAECASVTFDSHGRIVTICVGVEGPRLVMIDPVTLDQLAVQTLPPRQSGSTSIFTEFSGGGYFYLDDRDRAVVPTNDRRIFVVRETPEPGFETEKRFDLSGLVERGDGIVSALPDWDGLIWWVTAHGIVGTINPETGGVRSARLDGEVIANSFAVDETGGVFIVSDHALYRFDARRDGRPKITWRRTYERGTRQKPGQVSQGSGTTPTLLGKSYVAITDNADPLMHVVVYPRRKHGPHGEVCKKGVFGANRGSTDNSLIGAGRSMIVENNYGYSGPAATSNGASTEAGLTRVDLDRDGHGCRVKWVSEERAPSVVPKLSLGTGLVYTYTKDPNPGGDDLWYLTAIDFRSGRTVFERLSGEGLGYNNNYAPISLGTDGTAYVGVLGGLVLLRDGA